MIRIKYRLCKAVSLNTAFRELSEILIQPGKMRPVQREEIVPAFFAAFDEAAVRQKLDMVRAGWLRQAG